MLIGILFVIFAMVQGYLSGNPNILLDLRGIFYASYVVIFLYYVRSISQFRNPFMVFCISLIILSFTNLLFIKYRSVGLVGTYSNLTVMMSLYLLCYSISYYIHNSKYRRLFLVIGLLSFISCIASLQKQAYLGCLVSVLGGLVLVGKKNNIKVVKLGLIFTISVILIGVGLAKWNIFESIFNKSFEDYFYLRIIRDDVGDISSGRFGMWRQIVADAIERPFIGKGLGSEGFYFKKISILVHEHNIIMWSLRRFSIVGTIIFAIIGTKFFIFARSVYKNELIPFNKTLLYTSLIYFMVYFSINLVILLQFVFEPALIFWMNVSIVFLLHREQNAKQLVLEPTRLN